MIHLLHLVCVPPSVFPSLTAYSVFLKRINQKRSLCYFAAYKHHFLQTSLSITLKSLSLYISLRALEGGGGGGGLSHHSNVNFSFQKKRGDFYWESWGTLPKRVINLPWNHKKIHCKEESYWFAKSWATDKHKTDKPPSALQRGS